MFIVSKELQKQRLTICRNCVHRSKKFFKIFNADSCKICLCNLKMKTSVSKEFGGKCPVNNW